MILRASEERDDARRHVAELEAEHVLEEAHARVEIRCRVEDVAEVAGLRGPLVEDRRRALPRTGGVAGRVHDRALVGLRLDGRSHRDPCTDSDNRLAQRDAAVVVRHDLEMLVLRVRLDARDVVGVLRAQDVLDELAVGLLDHAQLLATVGSRKDPRARLAEPELPVERAGLVDLRHAQRHLGQSLQCHRISALLRRPRPWPRADRE